MALPIRKVAHIYVKELVDGVEKFVRLNYNIVSQDYQDGAGVRTFIEPAGLALESPIGSIEYDKADEVRTFVSDPWPGSSIGQ